MSQSRQDGQDVPAGIGVAGEAVTSPGAMPGGPGGARQDAVFAFGLALGNLDRELGLAITHFEGNDLEGCAYCLRRGLAQLTHAFGVLKTIRDRSET